MSQVMRGVRAMDEVITYFYTFQTITKGLGITIFIPTPLQQHSMLSHSLTSLGSWGKFIT